jgi:alkylhydroperoxidase family enzyme
VRSHTASAKRRGLTDEQLAAIAHPEQWPGIFRPEELVALDLATRLARDSHDLDAQLIARLRHHYDERQLAELLLVAGQANLNNRVGNAAKALFAGR